MSFFEKNKQTKQPKQVHIICLLFFSIVNIDMQLNILSLNSIFNFYHVLRLVVTGYIYSFTFTSKDTVIFLKEMYF